MRRTLSPGEVEIWYQKTETLSDLESAQLLAVLSPNERSRYTRFAFARDRRDYAAAHALLRCSLSHYADVSPHSWQFVEEPDGKPFLASTAGVPVLSFNLSHTHGLVACAIAGGSQVGVDVELVNRAVDQGVAARFFSAVENADLHRCASPLERSRRFCELWTLKEAYIKAIGKGLSHPLNTIVFEIGENDSIVFTPPADVDAARWQFALFAPTDDHRLAIAVRHDRDTISSIRLMAGDDVGKSGETP